MRLFWWIDVDLFWRSIIFNENMNKNFIINETVNFVKKTLQWVEWWHDWRHIYRVWNNAKNIVKNEKNEEVDLFIVELWALLHDIADSKFHNWDEEIWPKLARIFLKKNNVEEKIIFHVENIIKNISFKWWNFEQKFKSPELDIVQDADRLDAIWAIWIARTFNYWWHFWRELYNPEIKPNLKMTKEEYKNSNSPTLNHFYEKLFLLKDKMNTESWKKIAEDRHIFMENFLKEFYSEWEWEK